MQLLSCHNGRLLTTAISVDEIDGAAQSIVRPRTFTTGLPALDELLPHGGFVRGAVHEILSKKEHGIPRFFALLLADAPWPRPANPRLSGAIRPKKSIRRRSRHWASRSSAFT